MTSKTPYTLIEARASHADEILANCIRAFRDTPEGGLHIDKDKMRSVILHLVESPHQLSVLAIQDGRIKGVLLGHVDSHAYCKGLVASDICLYVAPKLRGSKLATQFVEIFDDWCNQITNLSGRSLGLSGIGATTPFMEKIFKDKGYSLIGKTYGKINV
jgi:hypothetical protein